MNPSLEHLTSIYAKWLKVNNISQTMSAEDLLYESQVYTLQLVEKNDNQISLTNDQKEFLRSFINIWSDIDNYDYENK